MQTADRYRNRGLVSQRLAAEPIRRVPVRDPSASISSLFVSLAGRNAFQEVHAHLGVDKHGPI